MELPELQEPSPVQVVEFYEHPQLDLDASTEAGRRVYVTKPYIKIGYRGSKDVFSRAATEADKNEHPKAWAAFSNTQNAGTPINKLPLDVSRTLELSTQYSSVETLAESQEPEAKMAKQYLELMQ